MRRIVPAFIVVCLAFLAPACKGPQGEPEADFQMSYKVGDVTFDMVKAPAGNLTLGVSADNRRKVTRGIAQPVALDGFVFSAQPVSQALWEEVMGNNPSHVKDPAAPVDMVSWTDIQKFLKKLGRATGKTFFLPTEAQWEYAQKLSADQGFTAVAEWCEDSYDEVPDDATRSDYFIPMSLMVNPRGPEVWGTKVVRTTLERMPVDSHTRRTHVGFRLVQPDGDPLTDEIMVPLDGAAPAREKIDASFGVPEYFTVGDVTFKMVMVQGGTFLMGFNPTDSPYLGFTVPDNEKNAHEVTLDDFAIGETEVTIGLWNTVMGSVPYLNDVSEPEKPVGNVSWYDCQVFLRRLNALTGRTFRLPTEAEWEYAARGGKLSRHFGFSGSNDLKAAMWFLDNADSKPRPVKTKIANELGIHDMSGNVWEWCYDRAAEYTSDPAVNPVGAETGGTRILRGGSCSSRWDACRISNRSYMPGKNFKGTFGLRLAL
ncbi:MAG: SUMF1/EgtB/PvdO family nonheme iron enzyme [Bacteroidales bacterium]|nr:SUMF1/EgtB/PvdO family nonheme iron enzyme [Bacteroidales bacterium]